MQAISVPSQHGCFVVNPLRFRPDEHVHPLGDDRVGQFDRGPVQRHHIDRGPVERNRQPVANPLDIAQRIGTEPNKTATS